MSKSGFLIVSTQGRQLITEPPLISLSNSDVSDMPLTVWFIQDYVSELQKYELAYCNWQTLIDNLEFGMEFYRRGIVSLHWPFLPE